MLDEWHAFTRRCWTGLATGLSHRAGAVLGVCIALSVVLAFGATKLTFATGQDSYLNKDSQIATDNRAYQELFGGEAMLTAFEVPEGQTILDLFTPENQQKMTELQAQLADIPGVLNAVTPLERAPVDQQPRGRPSRQGPHRQRRRSDPPAGHRP